MSKWCDIESDPGVFTELIKSFGVKGVQVEELYTLDQLDQIGKVYGLIFLFKWQSKQEERPVLLEYDPTLFFARQTVQNACATQAILAILLNSQLEIGEDLRNFKEFTIELNPTDRGDALGDYEAFRKAHNSFARQEPFEIVGKRKATKKDDVYHFISYVPYNGVLYEIDGIQKGPVIISECTEQNWLEKVKPEIQRRIEQYSTAEIRFNLMAIIDNKRDMLQNEIPLLEQQIKIETDQSTLELLKANLLNKQETLQQEEFKYKAWQVENARRKHNYVPFICKMLDILATQNKLDPLLQQAKQKQKLKLEEKKKQAQEKKQ